MSAVVLVESVLLAFAFISQQERVDRFAIVMVGTVILILAILIYRGPSLPRSQDPSLGGADVGFGDSDSQHHGGDDGGGHGGSDGGDGGGPPWAHHEATVGYAAVPKLIGIGGRGLSGDSALAIRMTPFAIITESFC